MNIFIVEDEIPNQKLLAGMINSLRPRWNIARTSDSVADATSWLASNKPDLIFMDVQLADGLCFTIFDHVKIDRPIIFTTAFDNYAIQAFRVNSVDYLLKPIKEVELERAIERFERLYPVTGNNDDVDYATILNAIRFGERKYRKRILIQGASSSYKLDVDFIAYFYTENKVTSAVDFNMKEHVVDFSLEALEEQLNPEEFFRTNRQTIVHINAVQKIEDYFNGKLHVTLTPPLKGEIVVSRLKNSAFKAWMGK